MYITCCGHFERGLTLGTFSIWHWLIVIVVLISLAVPVIFIVRKPPVGPNRFGELPNSMNFGEAIASFFRNYVNFSTRASRSEYWYSFLFWFGISVILDIVDSTKILSGIWALAIFLPAIAVTTRRLHDINRSGWHQLLGWLFPVGTIALIVWYCTKASAGDATVTRPVSRHTTMGSVEVLEKLAKLKESGAITVEEYEAEKRKILSPA